MFYVIVSEIILHFDQRQELVLNILIYYDYIHI